MILADVNNVIFKESADYQLIIYGTASIINPHVSFRRTAQLSQRGTKQIKCPNSRCNRSIAETGKDTKVEISRKSTSSATAPNQIQVICPQCKTTVGVALIHTA